MKTIVSIFLFAIYSLAYAQESCNEYFPFKKGAIFEYAHYNAKDKLESVNKTTVLDVQQLPDAWFVKTETTTFDEKNKELHKGTQEYRCQNGILTFDLSGMLDPKMMSEYKDMEVQFVSDKLELPSNLSVGQTLNDGSATMTVMNNGIKIFSMTVNVSNRKVDAIETITVPAGTFECFKITYIVDTKMLFKVSGKSAEWYTKKIGMVKQETYDAKGNKTGSTILKSFKD